jgi:hypothetical protein
VKLDVLSWYELTDIAGIVDSARSSTYRRSTYQPFNISYFDDSAMFGENAFDTVTIGDCSLSNFSFAVANDINDTAATVRGTQMGILGISAKEGKEECGHINCTDRSTMPTISEAMVSAGRIESNSYSILLDDSSSQTGSILFGGIDIAKFTGPLTTLRTTPDKRGQYSRQQLRLSTVTTHVNNSATRSFGSADNSIAVLLDTGSGGMSLPSD